MTETVRNLLYIMWDVLGITIAVALSACVIVFAVIAIKRMIESS